MLKFSTPTGKKKAPHLPLKTLIFSLLTVKLYMHLTKAYGPAGLKTAQAES